MGIKKYISKPGRWEEVEEEPLRPSKTTLTPKQQLAAISWAANNAGSSYGKFCITLTNRERDRIFRDYERFLAEKEKHTDTLNCE